MSGVSGIGGIQQIMQIRAQIIEKNELLQQLHSAQGAQQPGTMAGGPTRLLRAAASAIHCAPRSMA
ncbi:hypothetical protein ACFSTD_05345 [Novosphingobium colocasiae]